MGWIEKEVERPALTEVRAIGATCDACGRLATLRGGRFPAWAMFAHHVQGQGRADAVLCHDCTEVVTNALEARGYRPEPH